MELSTALNKNGRVNISTDGEFRFAVSAFVYRSFPWRDGDEITEEALAELKAADDAERAHESALRMLTARAHGEQELYRKLRQKYAADAAQSAVDRCKAAGLIDDTAFAETLAESLLSKKGWSPERVKTELLCRGVDKETAEKAISALDIDRDSGIIMLLAKMRITDASPEKDKARAIRRLLNAGYGYAEVKRILNVELNDES